MTDLATTEATLNITLSGYNGDFPDPVHFDSSDADIKAWAAEAVQNGDVPGIPAQEADLTDYVVDRFAATEDVPANRILLRPKTPFGSNR